MASSLEAADRLFRLGEYAELLRLTDTTPVALRTQSPRHRGLIAYALALVGDADAARSLVFNDDNAKQSQSVRSQANVVLGLAAESKLESRKAVAHFQLAVRFAQSAEDVELTAWAHLRLLRLMIDTSPATAVLGALPATRRAVLRAGCAQASAYLHILVTIIEGRSGRVEEGARHLDIADALLETAPNKWLRIGSLMNRGALASLEADLSRAVAFITAAKKLATECEQARARTHADVQLGYLLTLSGDFSKAGGILTSAAASSSKSGRVSVSVVECLSRLHLAQGRQEDCEHALEQIAATAQNPEGVVSTYEFRWAAITRARLYLKKGDPQRAVEYLREAEAASAGAKDIPFQCALHLTSAQALVRTGEPVEAAKQIAAATRLGVSGFRELLGAFYLASSEVTPNDDVARLLSERAHRVWSTQSIVSVPLEMRFARPAAPRALPAAAIADGVSLSVIERLAGAIDLAYSPTLFGDELLAAVRTLGSPNAEVIETPGEAPAPTSTSVQAVLTLGPTRTRLGQLHLVCPFPDDPSRIQCLTNLLRIGQTALDAERAQQQQREHAALWPADPLESDASGLFVAEEMQTLLATVRKIAPTTVPVLITGETGTGKEVLARAVHAYSNRAKHAFLPFNCTSTPRDMLDSQLFGHRRGSFTGASEHFPGIIRSASGGTLFLDEIGDMSLEVQPKLLRFLESGEIHPVGEAHPVRTDVRVVAATNVDLDTLVAEGRFREDLFYRLNIIRLHIPPLRERRVEIPSLAHHYLQKHGREWGKGDLRLSEEALEYLALYRWPGNVRQLANEMRRIAAMAEPGSVLTPQYLSPEVLASRRTVPASERQLDASELVVRLDQPMAAATEQVERAMLEFALRRCDGRIEDTADMLGLSRKGLYLKRHRFGIEPPPAALGAGS